MPQFHRQWAWEAPSAVVSGDTVMPASASKASPEDKGASSTRKSQRSSAAPLCATVTLAGAAGALACGAATSAAAATSEQAFVAASNAQRFAPRAESKVLQQKVARAAPPVVDAEVVSSPPETATLAAAGVTAALLVAGTRKRGQRKDALRRRAVAKVVRASVGSTAESNQRDVSQEAQAGGFFKGIKEFFNMGKPEDGEDEDAWARAGRDKNATVAKRVVVNSGSPVSQPFSGSYEEQDFRLSDRKVYKKVGQPAGSQPIYLLFNEAKQWAFTPHADGQADGWAFSQDGAMAPEDITSVFSVWNGQQWVNDDTLKVKGPGMSAAAKPAAAPAAEAAPQGAEGSAPAEVGTEAIQSEAQEAEVAVPEAVPLPLPAEAELLSRLHFKSHWRASKRCLVDWETSGKKADGLSDSLLPEHQGVRRGVLPNGLRYVIMRNAMPPKRFEAHIELHVGSIDEEPHEQGIAHMMEHVCFLGSRKRERLIGTGSRSNALTDFQHTIYHIHAPVKLEDGREMYMPALEALHEIAFAPEMLPYRIEKERKAVLAEMQQVNDMEYRIETWTLSGLHETNKLGTQFPIGKEEQIKAWQQKDLLNFHEKWYYPGNATLYVVGDLSEEEMVDGIEKVFSSAQAKHEAIPGKMASCEPVWGKGSSDPTSLFRRKIAKPRTEQLHNFSVPMIGTESVFTEAASFTAEKGEKPWHGPLRIFHNELLEGLQLNFYAKAPVRPLRTLDDIRHLIAVRILIGVLQFRIVSRYSSNHAPVQIDHSDSFREGCAVTSVTVNADPRDWRNGVACVVQEVRAVCDYGITESEMKRYMSAMLKDVEKSVAENNTVPSEDHLNFIMTSDVFDHIIMHPAQSYEAFKKVAPLVDREMVHTVAKWMLGYLGYYGQAAAAPPTAIVVCTPTQVFDEASGTWVPFSITEQEIVDLLVSIPDKSKEDALNQVQVPESLLKDHLETLLAKQPVDAFDAWRAVSRKVDDETGIYQLMLPNGAKVNYACTANESQGTMRLLVPGGRSADSMDELGAAMVGIRTISESGAVSDFSREQIELFAVSNLVSVHLDLSMEFSYVDASFSMGDNGLVAVLELLHLLFQEPRWELPAFVRAQQAYKAQSYAVQKSLEQSTLDRLLRMMYAQDPRVSEPRVEDLNKLTLATVRKAVAAQLRPQDLEINLVADFEGRSKQAHAKQTEGGLSTGKHRDADAGDEAAEQEAAAEQASLNTPELREARLRELDEQLWKYLGSLPPTEAAQCELGNYPQISHGVGPEERQQVAHLEDTDERAVANIGGGAPNRWGKGDAYHQQVMEKKKFSWDTPESEVKDHPLYASMCLLAMREVINTRLFSQVRDSLGLSYDCNFQLSMFDRLEAGWYTCTVSAHPMVIDKAVDAAKGVLQGIRKRPITQMELSTARRTLLRRHETDLQSNEYWISLLTHLQYDVPKDVSCVRDIEMLFNKLRWNDVQNAYYSLLTDPEDLYVSICTAGPGSSYVSGGKTLDAVSTSTSPKELVEID
eukprot:TRINITY_DN9810_c1_g1_i2.p1 TRINITY_DN9810_c1_g1~~TRINITY_DN9810_c1_g1_i2.p1  ORF type:complete len:1528 (-),score=512.78 TRINITY_DN9810_c1_g1_i2:225-4733(-)